MSPKERRLASKHRAHAPIFAALGDETRLSLLAKLGRGQRHSISQLTEGSQLSRQAITRHLRVLEHVRVIRGIRSGREHLYELDPRPVQEIRAYLDRISAQWDQTLSRLRTFVEVERPE